MVIILHQVIIVLETVRFMHVKKNHASPKPLPSSWSITLVFYNQIMANDAMDQSKRIAVDGENRNKEKAHTCSGL